MSRKDGVEGQIHGDWKCRHVLCRWAAAGGGMPLLHLPDDRPGLRTHSTSGTAMQLPILHLALRIPSGQIYSLPLLCSEPAEEKTTQFTLYVQINK